MPFQPDAAADEPTQPAVFATTHWSILAAAGNSAAPGAREALEKLCRSYWYPLYAYVRRHGHSPEEAQDLTQAFFARLLERKDLSRVTPLKGKFRSFLLASLKHFLADEWDRANRQKRGGGATVFSLDAAAAEERYLLV
jgi:RNA polymerase sigma-70 factor (ECF subfamily)